MDSIKNRIVKVYNWCYFPLMVFFLAILFAHLFFKMDRNDDAYFLSLFNRSNINFNLYMEFLKSRYTTWSSRSIIDAVLVIMVHFKTLWKILDSLVFLLIASSISKLTNLSNDRSINFIIVSIIFMIPLGINNSAGWIATTLNYLWPLAFGLFSMVAIKKIYFNEKIRWYEYALYSLALLYAANQEQMCCIALAVYSAFILYWIYKYKKVNWFMCLQTFLILVSITFILTCPGNHNRSIEEASKYFQEFFNISFIRKIELGFSSTMFEFVMGSNLVFMTFSVILFVSVVANCRDNVYRAISAVPAVVYFVFNVFNDIVGKFFGKILSIKSSMTKLGTGIKLSSPKTWLADLILLAVCLSILISLYYAFDNKKYSVLTIFILLLGFGSRMVMSFSPTIWASGTRTFIFMYASIVVCCSILYQSALKAKIKYFNILPVTINSVGAISFIEEFIKHSI